jgi:hypothetical protein
MPFQSEKQRRFLWAKHPEIARRWTSEHGSKPSGGTKRKALLHTMKRKPHADTSY